MYLVKEICLMVGRFKEAVETLKKRCDPTRPDEPRFEIPGKQHQMMEKQHLLISVMALNSWLTLEGG